MKKNVQILPMLETTPVSPARYQIGPEVIADDALQAARQAVCDHCPHNVGGNCRECCGSVPITVLKRLKASRCARKLWKE